MDNIRRNRKSHREEPEEQSYTASEMLYKSISMADQICELLLNPQSNRPIWTYTKREVAVLFNVLPGNECILQRFKDEGISGNTLEILAETCDTLHPVFEPRCKGKDIQTIFMAGLRLLMNKSSQARFANFPCSIILS